MRPAALLVVLTGGIVVAAPVPKSLRKDATADGVWVLVELNNDGRDTQVPDLKYCQVSGDRMSAAQKSVADASRRIDDLHPITLSKRDDAAPTLRTLMNGDQAYPAVVELDGDTLRFAFSFNTARTLAECQPGMDVYYQVFRRVADEK